MSDTPNLIKNIMVDTESGRPNQEILLALPTNAQGAVTVLCGRNRSGKTHILQQAEVSLQEHNSLIKKNKVSKSHLTPFTRNISCELLSPHLPSARIFYFLDTTYLIHRSSVVRIETIPANYERAEENISTALLLFLFEHFHALDNTLTKAAWLESPTFRKRIVESFVDVGMIYKYRGQVDFLSQFEKTVGGSVYLRTHVVNNSTTIELVLRYSPRHHYNFANWSHGQRVMFCYLCMLEFLNIEILFVDELENHLHPHFMSLVFDSIKVHTRQAILTTHHPHIIFSKNVDSVWYIEIQQLKYEMPVEEPYIFGKSPYKNTPLPCTVTRANSELEKLSTAYKIFDNWDNQLLRISQSVAAHVRESVAKSFKSLESLSVLPASTKSKADLQTDILSLHLLKLRKERSEGKFTILDFGCGRGRLFNELLKTEFAMSGATQWHLWEPNGELRAQLAKSFPPSDYPYVNVLENVPSEALSVDVIVIMNVLHECNASEFAQILLNCSQILRQDGFLVVVEMAPLLEIERFAVPYPAVDMEKILRESGWVTDTQTININNSRVSAYWTSARFKGALSNDAAEIKNIIEAHWREMCQRCCSNFAGRISFGESYEITAALNDLTTIASIQSYFLNVWK